MLFFEGLGMRLGNQLSDNVREHQISVGLLQKGLNKHSQQKDIEYILYQLFSVPLLTPPMPNYLSTHKNTPTHLKL